MPPPISKDKKKLTTLTTPTVSTFLFIRVLKAGKDSRLERIRDKPRIFAIFWTVQAIWVVLCCLPVIAVDSIPVEAFKSLPTKGTATDKLGLLLFLFGMADEEEGAYCRGG